MFHSNHVPISYRFQDRQQYQSIIAILPTPVYFMPPLTGFRLELGICAGGQKTRMMGLPADQKSFKTGLHLDTIPVCDG